MVLQALAALRPLVDRKARRLVDHQHQSIAVEQPRHHLFRCHDETAITAGNMNDSTQDVSAGTKSWWQRLTGGLKRTSGSICAAISDLVMRGPLAPERIVEIEEALIRTDLGIDVAARMATMMGEGRSH